MTLASNWPDRRGDALPMAASGGAVPGLPLVRGMVAAMFRVDPASVSVFTVARRALAVLLRTVPDRISPFPPVSRSVRSSMTVAAAVTALVTLQAGTSFAAPPRAAASAYLNRLHTSNAGSSVVSGVPGSAKARGNPKRGRDRKPPSLPGSVRVSMDARGRPTLVWKPASDNSGVVRYRLYRGGGYVASTKALSFRFSAVPCGAGQRLGVRAVDASGNRSPEVVGRFRRVCRSRSAGPSTLPAEDQRSGPSAGPAFAPRPAPSSGVDQASGLPPTQPVSPSGGAPTPPGVPVLVAEPTIAGRPLTGAELSASTGLWSGIEPRSFQFRWYRCRVASETCIALAERTNPTYVPTRADVGFVLQATVTAADSGGETTASSAQTGVVALSSEEPACTGVSLSPEMNLQVEVDRNPEGTTFCFRAGVYRLASPLVPKSNDSFIGGPESVLNGARDITSEFQRSGSHWVASNMTMERRDSAPCKGGSEVTLCRWLNDVYYDDSVLKRVGSVGELRSGTVYFDYPADKIYIADVPDGHLVEVGVTPRAIATLSVPRYPEGVTLRGLTIEKFANAAQQGAVEGFSAWLVDGNTFRLNHSEGLDVGRDSIVRNNAFVSNGQLGFGVGYWTNLIFEDNVVAANNYAGYNPNWEAGGAKFYKISGLIVRNNVSRDNIGAGLWTDWDSIDVLYEGNWVERNAGPGIFHEAGYNADIRGNYVSENGFDSDGWIDGSGILVNSSRDVEIYDNLLQDNYQGIGATSTDRGSGDLGDRTLRNMHVYGNVIAVTHTLPDYWAVAAGIAGDTTVETALLPSSHNRWEANRYIVCSHIRFHVRTPLTWAEWKAEGMDESGSMTVVC